MSLLTSALLTLGAGTSHAAAVSTTLYVSPGGSGTACSKSAPCSVKQAKQSVAALAPTMTGDIKVVVGGGTYRLTSPLTFGPADSGRNGHDVLWTAAAGSTPVFSGARQVTGWTRTATPGLWRAPLTGVSDSRQVYVDGRRATRARGAFNPAGFTATSTGYTTTAAASLATWKNASSIEFVYRTLWTNSRCPIGSVSGTTITMAQPCWRNAHASPYLQNNTIQYVENAYELLDQPGEWYLDRTGAVGGGANTLYYMPRPGERMTGTRAVHVTVPAVQQLLDASGTGTATPIHNVQFTGFTFADSTWLEPNSTEGFAEEQANFRNHGPGASHYVYDGYTKTPAAVHFAYAHDVLVQGNTLTRIGGAGLDVEKSSYDVSVIGNQVSDISGNGIQIGGITPEDHHPADSADRVHDITVENNYVHDIAVEFQGGVGIWGGFTDTLKVLHNEIADVPYTGISVGWGWGYLDQGGQGDGSGDQPSSQVQVTTPSVAANNQISYNRIVHFMAAGSDGGAVYTLGSQPNSSEQGNYYSDASDSGTAHGVYLDNGTTGYTVSGNVVGRTAGWLLVNEGGGAGSLNNPPAHNNTVTGNWTDTTSAQCCSSLNTYSDNTVVTGPWPSAAQQVVNASGLEPAWTKLLGSASTDNLASGATASASNVYQDMSAYAGSQAADGSSLTRWATDGTVTSATLTLAFPHPTPVNRVVLREAQQYGARIQSYSIDYWDGHQWVPTATGVYPGIAQTESFRSVTTSQIRLNITSAVGGPSVQEFEVYQDPGHGRACHEPDRRHSPTPAQDHRSPGRQPDCEAQNIN